MEAPKIFESEYRFCLILWENEPVNSTRLVELCKAQGIPYTVDAAPGNTGTDANVLGSCAEGIPAVLASLPIKNMHSPTEVLSLEDAEALTALTRAFVTSGEIKEVFA